MIDKHLKKPKRDLGGFVTSQKIQQTKSDSDLLNWVCGQGAVNILNIPTKNNLIGRAFRCAFFSCNQSYCVISYHSDILNNSRAYG